MEGYTLGCSRLTLDTQPSKTSMTLLLRQALIAQHMGSAYGTSPAATATTRVGCLDITTYRSRAAMQLQLSAQSRSLAASRCSRTRRVAVHAAIPADQASSSRQGPTAAVAMLSAAVMASAAFLSGPVAPAAADEEQTVIEGPFKGYSGEQGGCGVPACCQVLGVFPRLVCSLKAVSTNSWC
jgi:hypothetical protein